MLKDLIRVANRLDSLGLTKEADLLDSHIRKMAGGMGHGPDLDEPAEEDLSYGYMERMPGEGDPEEELIGAEEAAEEKAYSRQSRSIPLNSAEMSSIERMKNPLVLWAEEKMGRQLSGSEVRQLMGAAKAYSPTVIRRPKA